MICQQCAYFMHTLSLVHMSSEYCAIACTCTPCMSMLSCINFVCNSNLVGVNFGAALRWVVCGCVCVCYAVTVVATTIAASQSNEWCEIAKNKVLLCATHISFSNFVFFFAQNGEFRIYCFSLCCRNRIFSMHDHDECCSSFDESETLWRRF